MIKALIVIPLMRMLVFALLLIGTEKLCMYYCRYMRILIATLSVGMYTILCIIPGFDRLSHPFVHHLVIIIAGMIGIGSMNRSLILFIAFHLLLEGISSSDLTLYSFTLSVIGGLSAIAILWLQKRGIILPVSLSYGGKKVSIRALYDTGNTLVDPVSGKPVLVVSKSVANELTGLTTDQIRSPVDNLGAIPGLRLIPFKSIGNDTGFMLGLWLEEVNIGGRKGSHVIAFAPNGLDEGGRYQALAGGSI